MPDSMTTLVSVAQSGKSAASTGKTNPAATDGLAFAKALKNANTGNPASERGEERLSGEKALDDAAAVQGAPVVEDAEFLAPGISAREARSVPVLPLGQGGVPGQAPLAKGEHKQPAPDAAQASASAAANRPDTAGHQRFIPLDQQVGNSPPAAAGEKDGLVEGRPQSDSPIREQMPKRPTTAAEPQLPETATETGFAVPLKSPPQEAAESPAGLELPRQFEPAAAKRSAATERLRSEASLKPNKAALEKSVAVTQTSDSAGSTAPSDGGKDTVVPELFTTAAAERKPDFAWALAGTRDRHAAVERPALEPIPLEEPDEGTSLFAPETTAEAGSSRRPGFTIATPVGQPGFGQAVAARMSVMVGQNINSAQLQLNPANLGPVDVSIETQGDAAVIQFTAVNPAAREALESALPRLREMLAEQGFSQVNVDVGQGQAGSQADGGEGALAGSGQGAAAATESPGDEDAATTVRHWEGDIRPDGLDLFA